jgi:O-antigen/teichoic acid export membrane protein
MLQKLSQFEYFLKNGFWLINSYGLSFLIGIILAWVYGNLLSKNTFGEFTFILAILSGISIFSLPGMGQALVYSLVKKEFGNIKLAIVQTFYFSLLGSLFLLFLSFYYLINQQISLFYSLIILAFIFPLYSNVNYYQSLFTAEKKFKELAFWSSINVSVSAIAVLIAIYFNPSTPALIFATIIPTTLINLFVLIRNYPKVNQKMNKSYLKLGWHLSATYYIHFLTKSVDKILIGIFLPFNQLAIYAIALMIPDQGYALQKIFTTITTPKIAELETKKIQQIIFKHYLLFSLIIGIGIAFYILVAPLIFDIFFPQYLSSLSLTQVYALGLLSIPTSILTLVMQKHGRNLYLYTQDLTFLITLVISMIILIPEFGLLGAVFSQVIGRFFYTLITVILYLRQL